MRLSIREDDPGFDMEKSCHCKIFVDGDDVTSICYTADEEEGAAWCYALNDEGKKYFVKDTGMAAEVVLRGNVEIILLKNGTAV